MVVYDPLNTSSKMQITIDKDLFLNSKMEVRKSLWEWVKDLFLQQKPTKYRMIEGSTITLMGVVQFDL